MYNYPTSPEVSSVTGCTNGNKRCYWSNKCALL
jgi:hypothetical protein